MKGTNIFTAKPLSRRTVLRGVGATVALPFLDAMAPGVSALASKAARPRRFQAIFVPNGMAMEHWSPAAAGRDFELTPILQPLAAFRDQLLVFSGLNASWTYVHAGASGSFLTGTRRRGHVGDRRDCRHVDSTRCSRPSSAPRRRSRRSSCR